MGGFCKILQKYKGSEIYYRQIRSRLGNQRKGANAQKCESEEIHKLIGVFRVKNWVEVYEKYTFLFHIVS